MAMLRCEHQNVFLRSHHIFGRNAEKVDTLLRNTDSSQLHMAIVWSGSQWEIVDYSRNGTFIDGRQLPANIKTKLELGQKIRCGPAAEVVWQIADLQPPFPMLRPVNEDAPVITLDNFHFFPDEKNAAALIYLSSGGHWILESESDTKILKDGDIVQILNQLWQCAFPQQVEPTVDVRAKPKSDTLRFEFLVSPNEEHVFLTLDLDGDLVDLGERTHHYSLLTLARRRLEDQQRGLDDFSQGWVPVEDLSAMLGLDPTHLNTQLFRARTQIVREIQSSNVLSDIIERRRGEIRFRAHPFRIMRGKHLEASFDCDAA